MRPLLALLLLALAGPAATADLDVFLLHEKQPPVWFRLKLPADAEVQVRTLPAAQPASAALTVALARALGERPSSKSMDKLLNSLDIDEDGCLSPLELEPDLLTASG